MGQTSILLPPIIEFPVMRILVLQKHSSEVLIYPHWITWGNRSACWTESHKAIIKIEEVSVHVTKLDKCSGKTSTWFGWNSNSRKHSPSMKKDEIFQKTWQWVFYKTMASGNDACGEWEQIRRMKWGLELSIFQWFITSPFTSILFGGVVWVNDDSNLNLPIILCRIWTWYPKFLKHESSDL